MGRMGLINNMLKRYQYLGGAHVFGAYSLYSGVTVLCALPPYFECKFTAEI